MSTAEASLASLAVLGAAGGLPALCLAGRRWVAAPLSPLCGALLSAAAALCFLGIGGSFFAWFVGLAALSWIAAAARWWRAGLPVQPRPTVRSHRLARGAGAVGILAAAAYGLRGLGTPTVGYDTRVTWFIRSGWFLGPHDRAVADMQRLGTLTHAGYSPLVSSSVAVAWRVTGAQSDRVGVVVVAVLAACALVLAAWAVVELGQGGRAAPGERRGSGSLATVIPAWTAVGVAVLLVVVACGVTEPSLTNGYADPLWSLAAVGAVAFGLQLPRQHASGNLAVGAVLVAVAGETKLEGAATAVAVVCLLALRQALGRWRERRLPELALEGGGSLRKAWWSPLVAGAVGLVGLGLWPLLMRLIHTGADTNSNGHPIGSTGTRAHVIYDAMAAHLQILPLAVGVAVVGALTVAGVRRSLGAASDGWAWAALAAGLAVDGYAYLVGPGGMVALHNVLATSVHRLTEFPALEAWWIVGAWSVVGAAAVSEWGTAVALRRSRRLDAVPPAGRRPARALG